MPNRHHENVQGDFYVQCDVCTSCGAPQAEAPDLIDHSKTDYGHCFFKKQPETEEEIERAINAIAVSCVAGLRYGGTNEKILKRLYEMGEGDQCDHTPLGIKKPLTTQSHDTARPNFLRRAFIIIMFILILLYLCTTL